MSRNDSKVSWAKRVALGTVAGVAALVLLFGLAGVALAQGTDCLDQAFGLAANCTAKEFGIERLDVVDLRNGCTQAPIGQFTAVVQVWIVSNNAERFNPGFYIALDGGSAKTGTSTCYQDYLNPPLTTAPTYIDFDGNGTLTEIFRYYYDPLLPPPTYPTPPFPAGYSDAWPDGDGDVCGDMPLDDSIMIKEVLLENVACVDTTGDGFVDVDTCVSYQQTGDALVGLCTGLADAIPGNKAKCHCSAIEMPFQPTAIDLASFSAAPTGNGIQVTWETANELDNLGFNLYRAASPDGKRAQINERLIASVAPGNAIGATYTFLDEFAVPGRSYWYWLEDLDVNGSLGQHGPAKAAGLPGRPRPMPAPLANIQ